MISVNFRHDFIFLISSFGASCVLLFGVPSSPLAQPRNAICGQIIGATVGCVIRIIFNYINEKFIAATLSVAISILIMQLTNTLHAPGSATALNMILTKTNFPWYGLQYILMPTLSGTIILLIVAVIINNLSSKRHYPVSWW
jgi:CBS-domain-containing membrane protein